MGTKVIFDFAFPVPDVADSKTGFWEVTFATQRSDLPSATYTRRPHGGDPSSAVLTGVVR